MSRDWSGKTKSYNPEGIVSPTCSSYAARRVPTSIGCEDPRVCPYDSPLDPQGRFRSVAEKELSTKSLPIQPLQEAVEQRQVEAEPAILRHRFSVELENEIPITTFIERHAGIHEMEMLATSCLGCANSIVEHHGLRME